jgi:hypothetical protein
MANSQQTPNQKTQADQYTKDIRQDTTPSDDDQGNPNSIDQLQGNSQQTISEPINEQATPHAKTTDTRREREEEDRPYAGNKQSS